MEPPVIAALILGGISLATSVGASIINVRTAHKQDERQGEVIANAQLTRAAAEAAVLASNRSADAAAKSAGAATTSATTARIAAVDLDKSRDHESALKTLFWASDHAIGSGPPALMGLKVLGSLLETYKRRGEELSKHHHSPFGTANSELVGATIRAVQSVGVPTLLTVIAKRTKDTEGGGSVVRVDALVLIAAQLLLDVPSELLDPLVLPELRLLADATPGEPVSVSHLKATYTHGLEDGPDLGEPDMEEPTLRQSGM